MEQTKFIYLVIDRRYLKESFSTVRTMRFARRFNDLMQSLNYIMNVGKDDLIIVTMLESEYLELSERIERLCF